MNAQWIKSIWARPRFRYGLIAAVAITAVVQVARRGSGGENRVDLENTHLCKVQRGDLVVSILQSGDLRARSSRDILNEAFHPAKIVEIVDDGAMVTNGQLLVELESSQLQERYLDQKSDVAEAEAGLKLAQETLEIAKLKGATDLETAKLKVELAKLDLQKYEEVEFNQMKLKAESDIFLAKEELNKAENDLAGTRELFEKGYSNKTELEAGELAVKRKEIDVRNKTTDLQILKDYTHVKRQKELENAVSNAVSAYERLKKSNAADLESKEAAIESKKTRMEIEHNQLELRETQLVNTKIYADFDGQVFYPKGGRYSYRSSNESIEKGASVNYRQKILSFPDLNAWDIRVGIPEAMIDKVSIGQEAVATLDALPNVLLRGRVKKVSAVPDSQSFFSAGVKTYTVVIEVVSGMDAQLKPGMSATVEIVTDRLSDVLHVPIQSVVADGDKHYVYVVRRGRKKLREVKVGKYNTTDIEIIEGLEPGEELMLYAEVELATDSKLRESPLGKENGGEVKAPAAPKESWKSESAPKRTGKSGKNRQQKEK